MSAASEGMKSPCFLFSPAERDRTALGFAEATGIFQPEDHNCNLSANYPGNKRETASPSALAMSNAGGGDDDQLGGDETKKSERKRQRERQRRFDIANAFDELSSLLSQIDPEDDDTSPRSRRRRSSLGEDAAEAIEHPDTSQGHTRLDLIGRSVAALKRLHRENMELKSQLEQRRGSDNSKVRMLSWVEPSVRQCLISLATCQEVMLVVPTLTPVGEQDTSGAPGQHGQQQATGSRTYPPAYYQHPSPQMMHSDYSTPMTPHSSMYYGGQHMPQHYSYGQSWGGQGQSTQHQFSAPPPQQLPSPQQQQLQQSQLQQSQQQDQQQRQQQHYEARSQDHSKN